MNNDNRENAVGLYQRDTFGLFNNVDYTFKSDGSVDWKAMVPKQYLVFNKKWFENNDQEIPQAKNLSEVDDPSAYKDEQILILLAGIKEIAKLRGLLSVEKEVVESTFDKVTVITTVTFCSNYEYPDGLIYSDVASATVHNTHNDFQVYLDAIASNRSFVRAVRNALRIDIVGEDEIKDSSSYESGSADTGAVEPWRALSEAAAEFSVSMDGTEVKLDSFDRFKKYLLIKKVEDAALWNSWEDIPVGHIWLYLKQIKAKTAKK